MTSDVSVWLLEQIDADEVVARAAIDPDRPGTHWQWVDADTDELGYLAGRPSLRTVEEFPDDFVGPLPAFAIAEAEDVTTGVAAHIATQDPAHVLAVCAAHRQIVELHRPQVETVEWFDAPGVGEAEVCPSCHPAEPTEWNPPVGQAGVRPDGFVASYVLAPCPTLRALLSVYRDRPGFQEAWVA